MWQKYNANPSHNRVGDCTVRAISKIMGLSWAETYVNLAMRAFYEHDMPNADVVWGQYLLDNGFRRSMLSCDDGLCITVRDFCEENPHGQYLLCPKNHVLAVIDGDYYDTWDSGDEVVLYYWKREG